MRRDFQMLLAGIAIMIVAVAIIGAFNIEAAPVFNLVLLAGLIGVTVVYAYSTGHIAKETREQAKATIDLAGETRNARFEALRPIVWIQQSSSSWQKSQDCPEEIGIHLENHGSGPALNMFLTFIHPRHHFSQRNIPLLAVDKPGGWPVRRLEAKASEGMESSSIQAIYEDVYGRKFESKLELEINEQNKDLRPGQFSTRQLFEG